MRFASLFLTILIAVETASAEDILKFSLPVKCELNKTCFLQKYPDVETGPLSKDYKCGAATSEGHKGTDFRLLSVRETEKGVPVIAAAAGRVKALRDGMPDRLYDKSSENRVKARECGNGVVLVHGGGWETQYCHMLSGSIRVKKGEEVERGAPLGLVGYSGKAQFPHVHFEVRKDQEPIDPFTGSVLGATACGVTNKGSLWRDGLADELQYRHGELIEAGFAEGPVSTRALEAGQIEKSNLSPTSPALVFYARFINLKAGDRLRLFVTGPDGSIADHESKPLERSKAQYVAYAGKKRRSPEWTKGRYEGVVELLRAGKIVSRTATEISIK